MFCKSFVKMHIYNWHHHCQRLEQGSKSHQKDIDCCFSSGSGGISKLENLNLKMKTLAYWKTTVESFRKINMHQPLWLPVLNMFFTPSRTYIKCNGIFSVWCYPGNQRQIWNSPEHLILEKVNKNILSM